MRLIYSADALHDLIRLREFIATENPEAAGIIARGLKDRIENLVNFPRMGKPVTLSPTSDDTRDLILSHYVVRYQILPGTLVILKVWHHREDR